MTDAQINALAHEYAGVVTPYDKDEFYYEAAFRSNEKEFCKALEWLSERFCVAEKSRVLEEYDFNDQAAIGEAIRTGDMANKYILKRDLIETLFPELFKTEEK